MKPAETSARKAALKAYAARVLGYLELKGAQRIEADILQPAAELLDLYGEDIRARAYVTQDPVQGEMMLRPDFTVPVVRRHMQGGAMPARYCYAGEVFRTRDAFDQWPSESLQIGYELFAAEDLNAADAEVFSVIKGALDGQPVEPVLGDKALLLAAVESLETSAARKAALRRHASRPERFAGLLDRFGAAHPVSAARLRLLAEEDPLAAHDELPGLRSRREIVERIEALKQEAELPPIPAGQVEIVKDLLGFSGQVPQVMSHLRDLAVDLDRPVFAAAVDNLEARWAAFSERGIAVNELRFDCNYERSAMEYYDGFVFAFVRRDDPAEGVVATGGRYDALTAVLGGGAGMPAVGGVIRPERLGDLPC